MSGLELLAAALGLLILVLVVLATRRGEFDDEAPKYEMLGRPVPPAAPRRGPGRLGPTGRILRLGLVAAAFYYAGRIGWSEPAGLALAAAGVYLVATGLAGRDPAAALLRGCRCRPASGRSPGPGA